jgi:hypothetical protein
MSQTRRLAAILAADVAGYSRLMGADEEGTLARLKALRREFLDPKIAEYHGRIVKTTGDGILVEFASVVDAVRCAVAVQQAMPERNAGVAAESRIELRIGINLGDVIVEGDDLYGDGVNIAARIEALADAGGVFVSNTVYDHVRDRLPFVFEDLGEAAGQEHRTAGAGLPGSRCRRQEHLDASLVGAAASRQAVDPTSRLSEADHRRQLRRALIASTVGDYRHHRDGAADGLHQQGHLCGIRPNSACSAHSSDGRLATGGGGIMTTTGTAAGQLSAAEHSQQLRRAVVASTVGAVIEAYDFLLYVLVAPLVFAKLYFPESDPLVGTLQAFGIAREHGTPDLVGRPAA